MAALAARSDACRAEIADIRQTRADSQTTIAQREAEIREATQKRLARQQAETETLARARTAADNREEMSREMARLAERKAAAESEYDQTVAKLWDEYQLSVSQAEALCVEFDSLPALRAQVADLRGKIRALGSVNVSAIEEYKEVKARYDALVTQVTDVEESRNELSRMISKLSAQMREIFTDSFRAINENFGRVFAELFGGGEASLMLEDESDVLSSGIGIRWPRRARSSRIWRPFPAANRRWWPSASTLPFWRSTRLRSAFWTRSRPHWMTPTWCGLPSIFAG